MRTPRLISSVLAFAVVLFAAAQADAIRFQPRPPWLFGVGYGQGRGALTAPADSPDAFSAAYYNGASPHIRLGRMVGEHFMVSANWESWLIEFGQDPIKIRRSLQNLALGVAVFPGNQRTAINGLFLRAGVGMGWAGTGVKEAEEGVKQEQGERIDEWGIGFFGEAGYEFWVAHNFTVGAMATYNYFDINESIVDNAWFSALVLNLNLYF